MRTVNQAGTDLIKSFESCRLDSYQDIGGIWTIGFGHVGSYAGEGATITQDQADALFMSDLQAAQHVIDAAVTSLLNDNQYAAICSFTYNVGHGRKGVKDGFVCLTSGNPSTMLTLINENQFTAASMEFPKWAHAGGVESAGLMRRRLAEQALFRKQDI